MFHDTDTDERISLWREFRDNLIHSNNPLEDIVELWSTAPRVEKLLDPWDSQRWPTPWELLKENRFCPVAIPLMMGYTAKLSTKFSQCDVLIKIFIDHKEQRYYNLVLVDNYVLNYGSGITTVDCLPESMHCQYSKAI